MPKKRPLLVFRAEAVRSIREAVQVLRKYAETRTPHHGLNATISTRMHARAIAPGTMKIGRH